MKLKNEFLFRKLIFKFRFPQYSFDFFNFFFFTNTPFQNFENEKKITPFIALLSPKWKKNSLSGI